MSKNNKNLKSLAVSYEIQRKNANKYSHGGFVKDSEDEDSPKSVADSIRMRNKKSILPKEDESNGESFEARNNNADLDFESDISQPEDSNEIGHEEEPQDMVSRLRARINKKRFFGE